MNSERKAIVVGSAPISEALAHENLDNYKKICINKSWRLRDDFDVHVYLNSLKKKDRPSDRNGMASIDVDKFSPILNNAGGLFLTSGSVAMIAGYWAASRTASRFVSFYGCDLVFDGQGHDGRTHYYGTGDTGPLVGNFQYNLRQEERSIRLFCCGLLHRIVFTNSSAQLGTKLCFPHLPLHKESQPLFKKISLSSEFADVLTHAGAAFGFEARNRTSSFYKRQRLFEEDPKAIDAMNSILDNWAKLKRPIDAFSKRLADLAA